MTRYNGKASDDYNTPQNAWEDILPYVPKGSKLWLPFYNDGSAKALLLELGCQNVFHENVDFFNYEPESWDVLVDNPPFSVKRALLKRCLAFKKPVALLMPLDTLERNYFATMVRDQDFTLLIPKVRYKYVKYPPFRSCWFLFNFNMRDTIIWL